MWGKLWICFKFKFNTSEYFGGNENIDLNLFFDAATLREVDYDSPLESSKIRSSTGISVNWSAIGPLSFSYAIPITKETTDATEFLDLELEHLLK